MSFRDTIRDILFQVWDLLDYELSFPEPLGNISCLDMMMFWSIAYMLADSVSMVASRRD